MNRQLKKSLLVAACVAVAACSVSDRLAAADWLQFRGNRANSVAGSESLPTELSGRNMAWKVELPGRGLSGPIVVGDRVFVTASSGYTEGRLHVLSFDAATGKMQWSQQNVRCDANAGKRWPTRVCLLLQQRFDLHRPRWQLAMVSGAG